MRGVVMLLLVLGTFIFLASLGGGIGYAQGGGDVRIFSSWSEAHSQTGQAVAIYGDDANVVADNTPYSSKQTRGNDAADQLLILVLMVGLIGVGAFFGYVSHLSKNIENYEEQPSGRGNSVSTKEPRSYG